MARHRLRDITPDRTSVEFRQGELDALPIADAELDGAVAAMVLHHLPELTPAVREMLRVLKPGGQFLFLEHVLSETDKGLAEAQIKFTPFQVQAADGCHLDRRTLQNIKAAAFKSVDSEYFDLDGFLYLNPTIAGIATV